MSTTTQGIGSATSYSWAQKDEVLMWSDGKQSFGMGSD